MAGVNQRVSAKVIIRVGNKALILKPSEIDPNKAWHLPGGVRDDVAEPLRLTAAREVLEETGIVVDADQLRLLDFGEWRGQDQGDEVLFTALFFTASLEAEPQLHLSHEHDDASWVSIDQLNELDIKPEARACIEMVLGSDAS